MKIIRKRSQKSFAYAEIPQGCVFRFHDDEIYFRLKVENYDNCILNTGVSNNDEYRKEEDCYLINGSFVEE